MTLAFIHTETPLLNLQSLNYAPTPSPSPTPISNPWSPSPTPISNPWSPTGVSSAWGNYTPTTQSDIGATPMQTYNPYQPAHTLQSTLGALRTTLPATNYISQTPTPSSNFTPQPSLIPDTIQSKVEDFLQTVEGGNNSLPISSPIVLPQTPGINWSFIIIVGILLLLLFMFFGGRK